MSIENIPPGERHSLALNPDITRTVFYDLVHVPGSASQLVREFTAANPNFEGQLDALAQGRPWIEPRVFTLAVATATAIIRIQNLRDV